MYSPSVEVKDTCLAHHTAGWDQLLERGSECPSRLCPTSPGHPLYSPAMSLPVRCVLGPTAETETLCPTDWYMKGRGCSR